MRQAVSTLPENYREVVVLCDLEEMSYEEAASALGLSGGDGALAIAPCARDAGRETSRRATRRSAFRRWA